MNFVVNILAKQILAKNKIAPQLMLGVKNPKISAMNHDYGLLKYFDDLLLLNDGPGENEAAIVYHGTITDAIQETRFYKFV